MDQSTGTFTVVTAGRLHVVTVDLDQLAELRDYARWYVHPKGHVCGTRGKPAQYVKLHRVVLGLGPGDPGVDHRDGDPLNNARANLRLATTLENSANRAVVNGRGGSRFRGVRWDRNRWRGIQMIGGVDHCVGRFDTEEEAAAALAAFRLERGLPSY